ncbi:hypothetical protein Tco_0998526 [Tanacetum coccineum]
MLRSLEEYPSVLQVTHEDLHFEPKYLSKVELVHEQHAKSCSNHGQELEVLLVSETNQEAKWCHQQVDLQ